MRASTDPQSSPVKQPVTRQSPCVAAVGCGYWGKNIARNFAELRALSAICDTDPAAAARLGSEHRVPVLGWKQVLADRAISCVAIAAPANYHAELAREALDAGKHVFVEKPLATDVDHALPLCKLAAERKLVLMVGHLLQYHPAFLALKALVDRGELGRLQYIYSNRLNLGKIRREENILWSFAPHDISMILALTGEEPIHVRAVSSNILQKTVADVTTTHLSFPSGTQAHVFVSWLHPIKEQKLVVVGERGMAIFNDGEPWDRKLVIYRQPISWQDGIAQPSKVVPEPVALEAVEPLKLECQHFLDCVATGATPRTDANEGLRVLRVLQQAQRSMDEAWVK
jgi:UDP-2-acetamido-3-amino-2,3-dideoxy-glucuronate N-acetyltransferase